MKKTFLFIAILFIATNNYSQVKFLNKTNNEPVSNVKIFNQTGEIIDISNSKGIVELKKNRISENDSLNIFHSNFLVKYMTLKELLAQKNILLTPSDFTNLEQVIVTAKKPRYLKISGFFLSYQLIDNNPQSYCDGIIEYYIDLKKYKIKDYKIKYSRIFKNRKLMSELKKSKPKAVSMLGSNILPFNFKEEILLNEWQNKNLEFPEILDKDWVGVINSDEKNSNITIEYYTPENPRTISLLGLETIVHNYLIQESFNSNKPKIENLKSIAKYYSSEMKKKEDKIDYELEQDFFVSNFKYLNKEQYKSATEDLDENLITNFSSNYWEEYQNFIPPAIENKLYKELEIIEN